MVHYNDFHLSILLNNGNSTFQAPVNYSRTLGDSSVAVADVNGDGKLDLVIGSGTGISVMLGNGNGTFQAAVNFGPTAVWSVTVADVNGDGKLDIVATTFSSNTVNILLGNGDGTFQAGAIYTVTGASFASVGDLNGDGKPDLVVPSDAPVGCPSSWEMETERFRRWLSMWAATILLPLPTLMATENWISSP